MLPRHKRAATFAFWALVALGAWLFVGCATTLYGPNGKPLAKIQSDATNITLTAPGFTLHADRLSNSVPTRAALLGVNKLAGTIGSAAVAIAVPGSGATSMVTKAVVAGTPHVVNNPSTPAADAASLWPVAKP